MKNTNDLEESFDNMDEETVTAMLSTDNSFDMEDLNMKIKLMMLKSNSMHKHGKLKLYACKVCGKEGLQNDIKRHIEANHIGGVKFPCDSCSHIANYSESLKAHKHAKHEGLINGCDHCDFKTIHKMSLMRHRLTHLEMKFNCDQCDFKGTLAQNLKVHQDARHNGTKVKCDICNHGARYKSDLYRHKFGEH